MWKEVSQTKTRLRAKSRFSRIDSSGSEALPTPFPAFRSHSILTRLGLAAVRAAAHNCQEQAATTEDNSSNELNILNAINSIYFSAGASQ